MSPSPTPSTRLQSPIPSPKVRTDAVHSPGSLFGKHPRSTPSSAGTASTSHMPAALPKAQGGPPHLVSLVLQSKKALQHGKHLCTRAHESSNASAQAAVDVLVLDAKVKWLIDAVVEQLKLAASVAKSIEEKRAHVLKQVAEWDVARANHSDALDAVLDSLGSQLVPSEFYQTSADSSLFGSQPGSDDEGDTHVGPNGLPSEPPTTPNHRTTSKSPPSPVIPLPSRNVNGVNATKAAHARLSTSPVSPSSTLKRNNPIRKLAADLNASLAVKGKGKSQASNSQIRKEDRRYWKTLRDFVDDQSIDETLELIESDRVTLDNVLAKTDDYPEILARAINAVQASLPTPEPDDPGSLKLVQDIIGAKERLVTNMASVLENLASHYENMATALKESENGEAITEEELFVMDRDTKELPAIMSEIETDMKAIEGFHDLLKTTKDNLDKDLVHMSNVLDELDEMGDILDEMLQTQDDVEVQAEEQLNGLQEHITTLIHLHEQFISYRNAFNKLLLEIARRRQYREAAENIVEGMTKQLDSMTEEESRVRAHFNAEYGTHLPEDICLCIANSPTRWKVVPWQGSAPEVLPFVPKDFVVDARDRVGHSPKPSGAESL